MLYYNGTRMMVLLDGYDHEWPWRPSWPAPPSKSGVGHPQEVRGQLP
eukprot:SAG22_NODE_14091_length_384_cov_21.266667_1_plen_46_part_10